MIPLDDPRWGTMNGGYRIPFDASVPLRSLVVDENDEQAWDTLWEKLHNQGDVDLASYAAVPQLVRLHSRKTSTNWQFMGLVATIEVARVTNQNPEVPPELFDDYVDALNDAKSLGFERMIYIGTIEYLTSCFALVASMHGQQELAQAMLLLDDDVISELLGS